MKLPIHLSIEGDTIWTTYKSELEKLQNADELKVFAKRWENLLNNVKEEDLTEEVLNSVKTEILLGTNQTLTAELLLPVKVMNAMLMAQRFVVPLNCAFIQMNGGLGEFE